MNFGRAARGRQFNIAHVYGVLRFVIGFDHLLHGVGGKEASARERDLRPSGLRVEAGWQAKGTSGGGRDRSAGSNNEIAAAHTSSIRLADVMNRFVRHCFPSG